MKLTAKVKAYGQCCGRESATLNLSNEVAEPLSYYSPWHDGDFSEFIMCIRMLDSLSCFMYGITFLTCETSCDMIK